MIHLADPTPTPTITFAPEISPEITPGTTIEPGHMILFGQEVNTMAVFVISMALMVALTMVFVRALVKAGNLPPPAALVTALSVLTMLAIAGGILSDNQSAWTIAAAGMGALAGSVTAVFRDEASVVERVTKRLEEQRLKREQEKKKQEEKKAQAEQKQAAYEESLQDLTEDVHGTDDEGELGGDLGERAPDGRPE